MEVKQEIVSRGFPEVNARAFLSGYCKCGGSLRLTSGGDILDLSTDLPEVAEYLSSLIQNIYGITPRFSYTRGFGFRKNIRQYHVLVDEADYVLSDLEVDLLTAKIPTRVVSSRENSAAYIAGCFLSCGSVNDPSSSNYHLEIAVSQQSYAKWLSHLLNKVSYRAFSFKLIERRHQYVVYLKRSDEISDFIKFLGAIDSCFKYEDVRVDRDFANIGNRLANLEGANQNKTKTASQRQIEEIQYFDSHGGLERFNNPKLAYLARLRLNNPDASLEQLSKMMSLEFGATITKSNINHLFRRLRELYENETDSK